MAAAVPQAETRHAVALAAACLFRVLMYLDSVRTLAATSLLSGATLWALL